MTNLDQVKVTARDQQVLNLLVEGCSNREIGGQLRISQRTVKQHLRMLFLRTGILDGRKRVKLARYVREGESAVITPCEHLNPKESRVSILVCEGLTNREIGMIVGSSEQLIKNQLRNAFDKLESGVGWNWQCTWPAAATRVGSRDLGSKLHRHTLSRFAQISRSENPALTPFSSRSMPSIRRGFPAIVEADVRDHLLRRVASFCRLASTVGSLH